VEKNIIWIALFYSDAPKDAYNQFKDNADFIEKIKKLESQGRDSITSFNITDVNSKLYFLEGLYNVTGNNDIINNLIHISSYFWRKETLEDDDDMAKFYIGMSLRNGLLDWCIKHDRIENEIRNMCNASNDKIEIEYLGSFLNLIDKHKHDGPNNNVTTTEVQ